MRQGIGNLKLKELKWPIRVALYRIGSWMFLSRLRLMISYLFKQPHEQDFRFFRRFQGREGLFIDVGANAGQSVISFRIFNQSYRVISFEPNPFHEKDLRWIKRCRLGRDFEYHMTGLAEEEGVKPFYVPVVQGVPLTQEATFIKDSFLNSSITVQRIIGATHHVDFSIRELKVPIQTFDAYQNTHQLKPDIIKLDVQTSELEVLKGMIHTLQTFHPIIMIERGTTLPQIIEYLSPMGYQLFRYEEKTDELVPCDAQFLCLNVFFVAK